MAFSLPTGNINIGVLTAASDYNDTTDQYCLVKTTNGTTFRKTNTLGEFAAGVLTDLPSSGTAGNVCVFGVTKVRVNSGSHAAWPAGTKVCCSTIGGARSSTTITRYTIGRFLENVSSNSTGLYTIMLTHEGGGSSGTIGAA